MTSFLLGIFIATAFAASPQQTGIIQPVLPAILIDISQCESGGKQFNIDGSIVEHIDANGTVDYGLFQENSSWIPTATKLGDDILTTEGNMKFALWLYSQHNTRDWSASAFCWNKTGIQ